MGTYVKEEITLPSVTTILGIMDKSSALMGWATKCMQDYIIEKHQEYESIEELAKDARFNYKEMSKTALNIGSEVHRLIEIYIKTGKDTSFQNLPEEVENAFIAFLEWEKENVSEWIDSEQEIYDINIGYAGTLDAVMKHKNGKIYVVDFKSSKAVYDEYKYQLSAYYEAYNQTAEIPADEFAILRLDKITGQPEWVTFPKFNQVRWRSFETFQAITKVYYLLKNRRLKNNPIAKNIKEKEKEYND